MQPIENSRVKELNIDQRCLGVVKMNSQTLKLEEIIY